MGRSLKMEGGASNGPADAEKRQQQEASRRHLLDQILTSEARERRMM
jgi:DNA-binding TFAR19-related protein (PDSD5 family)